MPEPLDLLIVEDNPDDARLMLLHLTEEGYAPRWKRVETKEAYLDALRDPPDLILANYALPGFSGPDALRLLKSAGLDIPFILVSGSIGEEAAIEMMRLGASDYILKDRMERLGVSVRRALAEKMLRFEKGIAEDTLRRKRSLFRKILDDFPYGIYIVNRHQEIEYANSKFAADFGDWASCKCHEFLHGRADPCPWCENAEVFAGSTIERLWHSDKTAKDYELASIPIKNTDGTISKLVVFHDVTARRRAEEEIRGQQNFLRTLIDCMPIPVFYKDREGRFLGFNKAYEDFTDIPRSELIGKTVMEILPSDEAAYHHRIDLDLIRSGGKVSYESHYTNPGGKRRDIAISKAAFMDEKDVPEGIVAAFLDVTARKRAEEALRASEEQCRLLAETSRDIILVHDMEGRILFANKAGLDYAGLKKEEAIGRSILDFVPPEWQKALLERQESRSKGDLSPYLYEAEFLKGTGERVPVEVSSAPIVRGGAVSSILIVARNITERKQAQADAVLLQAQFAQAQKMEAVGRLAGGVAHDFNNMLTSILGFTEIAMAKLDRGSPIQDDLKEVRAAGKRSAEIVRQLLAFARRQPLSPRLLSINETIDGMLKMLRRLIGEDIELAWRPQVDLWRVMMDPSQIDQILANLCVNARDALPQGGKIAIETRNVPLDEEDCAGHEGLKKGNFVLLAVSDNGCGMDKETLAKIFEPFFTTKEAGRGTGLGLATVYGIVNQNDGLINVYSEPGVGTTFKIYLPMHPEESSREGMRPEEEIPKGRGETVLIAEDEETVLMVAKRVLEKLGYKTLAARRPNEAIAIAESHTGDIHLLLTDVVMPQMNGKELAQRLKALRPGLKVLFMSGYTADAIALHGIIEEGVEFIQKPLTSAELGKKIRKMMTEV